MRVKVADYLHNQQYRIRVTDPYAGGPNRINKLAEIEKNAVDFANTFLLNFDFPSTVNVSLLKIRGLEDLQESIEEKTAVVSVQAEFTALNQHKFRLEIPIPMVKGTFFVPAVAVYKNKKNILSQSFIDALIESVDSMRPKLHDPMSTRQNVTHEENRERPLFSAPDDPSGWSDLISERYM
jgi:hypothetical protein